MGDQSESIDDEHFEDFTTASDWEVSTANLEHLLTEWQSRPVESDNLMNNWVVFRDNIGFGGIPFQIGYFKDKGVDSDKRDSKGSERRLPPYLGGISDSVTEFPPKYSPHIVSELFHVAEFVVISPSSTAKGVENENELKIITSSACIALNNTRSTFPIFVQYHEKKQGYFYGIAESYGIRTTFQMIHLKSVPKEYHYLSGLLSLFSSKIGTNTSVPIRISAHFFYSTKLWHPQYTFETEFVDLMEVLKSKSDPGLESCWKNEHAFTHLLPFGCSDDPFTNMRFVAGMPSLTEDVVVDTSTYSDLDPNLAPESYFGLEVNKELDFRLTQMLEGIWNLEKDKKSVEEILGKKLGKDESEYSSALDRIALGLSPLPVVNRVISGVNKAQKQLLFSSLYTDLPPIEKGDMDSIVNFLFPDALPSPKNPYPNNFHNLPQFSREHLQETVEGFSSVKSCPMGSLVWRLVLVLSYQATIGYGNLAHIWAEVVLELRYRWDNSIMISGLEPGSPNTGMSLLYQKFQMLNCCIEKKLVREKQEVEGIGREEETLNAESDDEEFYDCEETVVDCEERIDRVHKPVGRLSKCGTLRLLKSREPLFIPITQDPAPLTEDGFEEQTKMLVELGDDEGGTEQRAKLLSASLVSDIQSFKAANPGCELEDFVRWYSPRDWIEDGGNMDEYGTKGGELSARMKMPGNLWLEVWSSNPPVPARRQKRLFDDTQEAEKILSWLTTLTVSQISQLIFPTLAHAATLKVLTEADSGDCFVPPTLLHHLTQLTKHLGEDVLKKFGKESNRRDTSSERGSMSSFRKSGGYKYSLMTFIAQMEKEICEMGSFKQKFPEVDLSLGESSHEPYRYVLPSYYKVEGGIGCSVGDRIRDIFGKEISVHDEAGGLNEFKYGEPLKKVFVLKSGSGGSGWEGSLPQRMSCCIKKNEFKVAGTFSWETTLR